ncbi:integrase core domain-containing protein [Streptomyces sp. enrichment culture]|uniref:integrase core domain-containing protein n=1 Tax=Streptomyces sp. enrichment culture TaxID=1795815 RepID=UPI003F56F128
MAQAHRAAQRLDECPARFLLRSARLRTVNLRCFQVGPGPGRCCRGRAGCAAGAVRAGVRQSMGAIGSSTDNTLAESFNATFKRETLQGRKHWPSERGARLDAFGWLHRYNTRRRHSRLGHRSPIAYETASRTTSTTLAPAA